MHARRYAWDVLAWDDLRVFLAVHRTRNHAAAGRTLRVAATTIGRRVRALEAAVGARLFTRTPEGLAPTAAALALLSRAERVEAEVLAAERELAGADARATGTVRVTCGDGFASFVLAPALPTFLAAHPGLAVEVRPDPRALDLTRGEADVALRHFRPRERTLLARRLGVERYALYASPAYLARRGAPRTAADLCAHDLVLYDRPLDTMRAQAWLLGLAGAERIAVRTPTTMFLHSACEAGCGIAVLTQAYVLGDPRYVRVLPGLEPPAGDVWAVTHPGVRSAARVELALRWLGDIYRRAEAAVG